MLAIYCQPRSFCFICGYFTALGQGIRDLNKFSFNLPNQYVKDLFLKMFSDFSVTFIIYIMFFKKVYNEIIFFKITIIFQM